MHSVALETYTSLIFFLFRFVWPYFILFDSVCVFSFFVFVANSFCCSFGFASLNTDAYAVPANFLEIDVVNPMTTITAGKKRFTDYEVRMRVSTIREQKQLLWLTVIYAGRYQFHFILSFYKMRWFCVVHQKWAYFFSAFFWFGRSEIHAFHCIVM